MSSNLSDSKNNIQSKQQPSKMVKLWRKYGYLAIGTYLSIYVTTLGAVFLMLDIDLLNTAQFGLDPVDAAKIV